MSQNFEKAFFSLLGILRQSPVNYSDLSEAFDILKDFYSGKFGYSGYVIGRKINEIFNFSELNSILAQKEEIAQVMFKCTFEEEKIPEEEILEWLRRFKVDLIDRLNIKHNVRRL